MRIYWWLIAPALMVGSSRGESPTVTGDAVLIKKVLGSDLVLTTTTRVAGAFHSLTYRGKEYLDSADHGRQMQSASNFDCGKRFIPEIFNPTEAGSESDHVGPKSSSRLLSLKVENGELVSENQMAFWLRPGAKSLGHPACNTSVLSNHLLKKRVRIGYKDLENVIDYQVTFTVPPREGHTFAQFEALTGYMPWEFSQTLKWDAQLNRLAPLEKKQGEQEHPVALATANGDHAMGVFSPQQPSRGYEGAGYGRFHFPENKVVKWNCVFRLRDAQGIPAGNYHFRMFVVVGSVDEAGRSLGALVKEFKK